MKTICHSLLQARQRPESPPAARFVSYGKWRSLSWQDYFLTCSQIGAGLAELGVSAGDRVGIFSNTRADWAMSDCGILGIGAVTVPIYQSSVPSEIEYILNNSETSVLFVENQSLLEKWLTIADKTPSLKWIIAFETTYAKDERIVQLSRIMEMGAKKLASEPEFFAEACESRDIRELATIVYTSGTTGVPKGVMLSHEQIMSEILDLFQVLDVTNQDTSLTFLPFAHILGRVEHWAHVHLGFMMGYAESVDRIKQGLQEIRPTFLVAVPRIFEKLHSAILAQADTSFSKSKVFEWALKIGLEISDARSQKTTASLPTMIQYQMAKKLVFDKLLDLLGGRLKFAFSGGAPLGRDIARFFHAANIFILEGYGLTETTAGVFVNSLYDYKFGTVGKAVGDVELKFKDDGEICVRSKKIMLGYYKDEDSTREVLSEDGWLSTGDIGELSYDGFLRITDRKKDLIKTAGGKFVAPQKLENLLKGSRYISNALIYGDKKKYIVALITLNFNEINRLADSKNLATKDHQKLIKQAPVREVIRQAVAEVNAELASWESIKAFDILPEDFTIESGELTPSLKVRRKFCSQKYATILERLYGDESLREVSE